MLAFLQMPVLAGVAAELPNDKLLPILIVLVLFVFFTKVFTGYNVEKRREERRNYYRNVYLKSENWQRKRALVLKRDNYVCNYCKGRATEVHHLRYAKWQIGKEPIDWLVSVCRSCHEAQHRKK